MDIYNIPLSKGVGDSGARTVVTLGEADIAELRQATPDAIPTILTDMAFHYLIENPMNIDQTLAVEPGVINGVGGLESAINRAANDASLFEANPEGSPIQEALLTRHGLTRKGETE